MVVFGKVLNDPPRQGGDVAARHPLLGVRPAGRVTEIGVGQAKLLGPGAIIPAGRQAAMRDILSGHWSEPVELFPLLMIIVLMILVVENLLANKFYRSAT